jgi:hypothetical protein
VGRPIDQLGKVLREDVLLCASVGSRTRVFKELSVVVFEDVVLLANMMKVGKSPTGQFVDSIDLVRYSGSCV